MIVKFLFEDKNETPSSVLLRSCMNGDNIYFSGGNENLMSKLNEIYNKDDLFIVFIDVVPNNLALLSLYRGLVTDIEAYDMDSNVVVLPIPCIEYYIIDMLTSLEILFTNDSTIRNLYENLHKEINWGSVAKDKRCISIEKLYKDIINLQKPYCLRNTNKSKALYYGDFYRISCTDCNNKYCKNYKGFTYEFKSEFLYTRLPIFDILDDNHYNLLNNDFGIETKTCTIKEAKDKLQNFYNILCSSVKQGNIIVV